MTRLGRGQAAPGRGNTRAGQDADGAGMDNDEDGAAAGPGRAGRVGTGRGPDRGRMEQDGDRTEH